MDAILAGEIFKRIFLNENISVSIQISLKSVSKGLIDNRSALVQVMAWRRRGNKPLPEGNGDPVYRRIYAAPGGGHLGYSNWSHESLSLDDAQRYMTGDNNSLHDTLRPKV